MKKILWIDVETTGLNAQKHGIIQLAMLIDIDGKLEGELLLDIQPFPSDLIEFEANGRDQKFTYETCLLYPSVIKEVTIFPSMISLSMITDFLFPKEAYKQIQTFLDSYILKFDKTDKAYLGGHNVNFDRGFISKFFKKNNDNYLGSYLNWRCLDLLYRLWEMDYKGKIALENYKLETACNHFGIPISTHNAMSDIKATRALWYMLETKNA